MSSHAKYSKLFCLMLLGSIAMLSACGGGSSSNTQNRVALSGNWQFTVTPPQDNSFTGGIQGGFLLQDKGNVTGGATYAVFVPSPGGPALCNGGSAPITGTMSGQNVTLTAVAANQTFTFTGTLSADGSAMSGTYSSTAGTAQDGSACGTAQSGLQWTATSVPALTGPFKGFFHSTRGFRDENFA